MGIVELRGIRKTYVMGTEEVHALAHIDLDVPEGEFIAIMGSSGSGKSTMLNILGCLDRPTDGAYLLGGKDVSGMDDDALSEVRARRIGFVFQSFNLLPQLTVVENVEVPLFYQGVAPAEGRQRSTTIAERVGLAGRLGHRPTELSGGQQQRVAIARALVNDPLILLADEPTGNLDSRTGAEILEMLLELNRSGRTLILVTHDPAVAAHAHRTIVLRDGRIVEERRNDPGRP